MKFVAPIVASSAVFTASCVTFDPINEEDRTLAFGCDDIVVIGKLSDQVAGETVQIEGDYLGHGWFEADLRVRRTVHGDEVSEQLPVKYFAHTFMRSDKSFMFVLSLDGPVYNVETARLMSVRPIALDTCD